MKKISMILSLLLCISALCKAQGISIVEVKELQFDTSASTSPRYDKNGFYCALLLVDAQDFPDLTFEGDIVGKVTCTEGVYKVYVPANAKSVTIFNDGSPACSIDFVTYAIKVRSAATYKAVLRRTSGSVTINTGETSARVMLDGTLMGMSPLTLYDVKAGSHTITAERYGVGAVSKTIYVVNGQKVEVNIDLSADQATAQTAEQAAAEKIASEKLAAEKLAAEQAAAIQNAKAKAEAEARNATDSAVLPPAAATESSEKKTEAEAKQAETNATSATEAGKQVEQAKETYVFSNEMPSTKPTPKPLPKSARNKSATFIMGNIGYSADLTGGIMAGWVKNIGLYVKGKTNFRFTNPSFTCSSSGYLMKNGYVTDTPVWTKGKDYTSAFRWNATAGLLARTCKWLYLYAGAGYGSYSLYWMDSEDRWGNVGDANRNSIAADGGLIFKLDHFALSAGVNYCCGCVDGEIGIGVTF